VPLPSGTVVQADVKEEYELSSGQTASEEPRRQDVLLFQAPSIAEATPGTTTVRAEFPIAPSRTFELTELVEGTVSLAILAGRESVRGTLGGNQALTLEAGGIVLTVPASSLAQDTAVSITKPTELSSFLATGSSFEPVSEALLDFAGASLTTSAGLSIEGTVEAGETWLVVRVDRVLGIPRLLVVALAEASGGRIAALAIPGLPGIREDGRYVFYRVTEPIGWVSGLTTLASTGQGVSAVVESDRLPFIARSFPGVPYLLATGVGAAHVTATAPGSPLSAAASIDVPANTAATPLPLPLALEGAVTTATITPADESEGVSPTAPIELLATAPLQSDAGNFAKVVLRKGTAAVEVRYLLSGSGKRLAIIPAKPLDVSTSYTVAVGDLKDAYGASVVVSNSTFRTKDLVAPTIDTEAIVFEFPVNGITKITAAKGTLPPFAQVVIINATTGEVGSFQVDGDGGLGFAPLATMQASVDDLFMVTITDTNGNVYTFQRSKFVKDDGTVVIGPGGGTVTGPGGVELRLPSGALETGVELKVEGVTPEQLAQQFPGQVPDLGRDEQGHPLAHVGGGLQITSNDKPAFKKEVDLVFPLPDFTTVPEAQRPPAGKPEDAYYYVVRRVEGPADAEGHPQVLFQTIDHAFLECPPGKTTCEAGEKKLVTASYPFSGYLDSYGAFGISPVGAFALQPVVAATAFLMWTYNNLLPGKALAGVVTGKVLRTRWDPLATVPTYEPVEGAVVTAVQMTNDGPNRQVGERLLSGNAPMATTGKDGTFTLWDPRYVGGTVQVAATLEGGDVTTLCPAPPNPKVVCGTAYEADPLDWKSTALRFHGNIATVNLTFPPVAPQPPAPAIEIKVFRTKNGQREDTLGISSLGEPLILGLKASAGLDLREVQIQGDIKAFSVDPLQGQPNGMSWIVEYQPGTVGTYRVEATGLRADPAGLPEAIKGGTTFRVIGEAGRDDIVESQRPEVIPDRTFPTKRQTGVSVTTFVRVVFTEPVRKISGNVTLKDPSGNPVPVKLSGVKKGGGVIDDLDQSPDAPVTSLTVQPLTGLQYGIVYKLSLSDGIQDLDTTACAEVPTSPPCTLVPYETTFTTFNPESLSGGVDRFGSPGIVVLGERAYLVHNFFSYGTLRVFETTDPVSPVEIPNGPGDLRDPRFGVAYRPVDIVGEDESPLTGGRVVVVATGPAAQSKPSNIWLLDVNDDSATRWIGAVSLTATAAEGFINRTFMRAGVLYSATQKKGIQVVDLGQVMDNFKPLERNAAEHFQMRSAFLTDGQGYGQENVVSIPVQSPFGGPARLSDLKAGLVQTTEGGLLVVAAAADHGLVVANPGTQAVLSSDKVTVERVVDGQTVVVATLLYGQAIGMGNVAGQDVTAIVGSGTILGQTNPQPMLMVVSLFDPEHPKGLGYLLLDDATVGDVLLKDDLVLLGGSTQVTVVSLTNPTQPRKVGTITGVGGRLALGPNNVLFSTAHSVFGGADLPLGGVRTATLATIAMIQSITPSAIVYEQGQPVTEKAMTIQVVVIPASYEMSSAQVEIYKNGALIETLPAQASGSTATAVWPAKRKVDPRATYTARAVVDPDSSQPLKSAPKDMPLVQIVYVGRDGNEASAPPKSDPQPVVKLDPLSVTDVTLIGDGSQAQVRLKGEVTDALADVVPGNAADIAEVRVGEQSIPVTRVTGEPVSVARPYAFRGRFQGTVTVDIADGANDFSVVAKNSVGNTGSAAVGVTAKQEVIVPEAPDDSNTEAPKFLEPFTLGAGATQSEVIDSLVLVHGPVELTGSEERLTETGPSTLAFTAITPDLGNARLVLNASIPPVQPARRSVSATLTSGGLGIDMQPLDFVETAAASGLFRSVALRLPTNAILEVAFPAVPSSSTVDSLTVKLGLDPQQAPSTLTETAPDSNAFSGPATGLGPTTVEIQALSQLAGEPGTLRIFLTSGQLGLSAYFLELRETAAGDLRYRTSALLSPALPAAGGPPTVVSTQIVSVAATSGTDEGFFSPVWVVAKGLTSFGPGDIGQLDGSSLELSLAPLPGPTIQAAAFRRPQVRLKDPVVFVADPGSLNVPNVKPSRDEAATQGPPHTVRFTVKGEPFSQRAGTVAAFQFALVAGTKSNLILRLAKQLVDVTISGEGISKIGALVEDKTCDQQKPEECVYTYNLPVEVTSTTAPGRRDVTLHYAGGQGEQTLKQYLWVTHRRLIVFAIDGVGWDVFEEIRSQGRNLGRIFGTTPAEGQNVARAVSTTFTPITYGRWATVFSGTEPGKTGIPSNHFLNRRAYTDEQGDHGDPNQCLNCGQLAHSIWPMGGFSIWPFAQTKAYTFHFKDEFIYDKLRKRGTDQRRSVVIAHQAGLGRLNAKGESGWTPDRWHRLDRSIMLGAAVQRGAGFDKAVRGITLDELEGQPLTNKDRDFDIMVLYFGGHDAIAHRDGKEAGKSHLLENIDKYVGEIVDKASRKLKNSAIYAVVSDHGHIDVTAQNGKQKFMNLDGNGMFVSFKSSKDVVWRDVLTPRQGDYRVGKTLKRDDGSTANVIFAPEGGIAHIYVANEAQKGKAPDWTKPPSLETLRPLINNAFKMTRTTPPRSVSDILVRMPDPGNPNAFGPARYRVLSQDYQPVECGVNGDQPCASNCGPNHTAGACTLEAQLLDLDKMIEPPFASADPAFGYSDPANRVEKWRSENTGDIVLLANMEGGYYFDSEEKASQHGSLTFGDSIVPLAFAYPGATSPDPKIDNVLKSVADYLREVAPLGSAAPSPVEEPAMECALGGGLNQPGQPDHCPQP
jgi:hypothetical protein